MLARAARTVALLIAATIVTGCFAQSLAGAAPTSASPEPTPRRPAATPSATVEPSRPPAQPTPPGDPAAVAGPPFPSRDPDVKVYDRADVFSDATEAAAARRIADIEARQSADVVVYTQTKPGSDAVSTYGDARVLAVQWRLSGGLVVLWNITGADCAPGADGNGHVQLYAGSRYSTRHLSGPERKAVVDRSIVPLLRDCNHDEALLAALDAVAAGSGTASSPTPSPRPPASGEGACADSEYELSDFRWERPYDWHLQEASIPDEYEADEVLKVLERSAANITNARNDCGLPDNVDASARYAGTTTAEPCVSDAADGYNSVGFAELPPGTDRDTVAFVCTYGDRRGVVEADILINLDVPWALFQDDCRRGEELLEATMTHEFGHVFGLAHVSEREHGDLTMSPISNGACAAEEISLGLGDILGLEELY